MNRKRPLSRQPLKETSGNIPSPNKKLKLKDPLPINTTNPKLDISLQPQSQNQQNLKLQTPIYKNDNRNRSRLVGEELSQWRISWKKIMKSSVVYFDTQGVEQNNPNHQLEQKKAIKALKFVGSAITPFYDKSVSIIISRRSYNSQHHYNSNDIFHDASNLKIKVWNYDKVFRFFKNLGITDFDNLSYQNQNHDGDLYNLLRVEKIFGSTDKDPNAKREDMHYFDKNYLYVYDLSQNVRPIAVREWYDDNYPILHLTLDGKCPFIMDSENSERKKIRRSKKFQENENYRKLLKKSAYDLINNIRNKRNSIILTSSSILSDDENTIIQTNSNCQSDIDDNIQLNFNDNENNDKENEEYENFKHPKPNLIRNSSCLPTNNSNGRFYDVAASGFNGESNAIQQFSIDSGPQLGGNGLGPTISQVPSKNINNLKRRIFMKKQKQKIEEKNDLKPGYCENCRVKYDYFDDHINSNRHRKFAIDDSNFADIDRLIGILNDSKSFGFITSDGDFSYSEE